MVGQWKAVVRYDGSRDGPHRDLLDSDGHVINKNRLAGRSLKHARNHAMADLKTNWPTYRAVFGGSRDRSAVAAARRPD